MMLLDMTVRTVTMPILHLTVRTVTMIILYDSKNCNYNVAEAENLLLFQQQLKV